MNKQNFLLILATTSMGLIASQAYGEPAITAVNGAISNSNSITISGTRFGVKSPVAPVLWDTAGNQSAYANLSNGATIPASGGPWSNNGNNAVKYATSNLRHNKLRAMYSSRPANANIANIFSNGLTINGGNLYISWWAKPSGRISESQSTKVLRLSDNDSNGTLEVSWTNHQFYYFDTSTGTYRLNEWAGWNGVPGAWNRSEVWWNANSVKAWVNSEQRINASLTVEPMNNNRTLWSAPRPLNHIYHLGYDPNSVDGGLITMDFGEIYIDNTPARVEICSGAAWSSRAHCEIQIPTAWSDTATTITVNQATFLNDGSTTYYLFVVDPTGTPNSTGYPIKFSSSTSSQIVPPQKLQIKESTN